MLDSQNKPPSLTSQIKMQSAARGVRRFWLWIITGAAVIAVFILGSLYWHSQTELKKTKDKLNTQQSSSVGEVREENKQLIEKIGKLIILPTDEEPTIATVTDLSKLQGQPFFAKAQLGDKVLIYAKAKKAILYRPETNQVIELAPLIDNAPATPTTPAP